MLISGHAFLSLLDYHMAKKRGPRVVIDVMDERSTAADTRLGK
jgi:hypothetical protein